MTDLQWKFEYLALQRRDAEHAQMIQIIQDRIVDMLGLNVGSVVREGFDYKVPLSLLVGNPEMLKTVFEQAQQAAQADDAVNDNSFDEFSKQLMEATRPGEDIGDIVPFAVPIDTNAVEYKNPYLYSEEYQSALTTLVELKPGKGAKVLLEDG
jgi:hypothetical protein